MPAKPVTTFTFATDPTFSSGPAATFPTKIIPGSLGQGFIPGNGVNAEWVNYLFNITGSWISDWISLGSSSADLDAHVVETNVNGTSAIAALELGGTASADRALVVNENSGFSATAVDILNSAPGGFGALVTTGSTQASVRAVNVGSGPAIQGLNLSGGPGGSFTGNTNGAGAVMTGGSSGPGFLAVGNGAANGGEVRAANTGSGLLAERQTGGGPAIRAEVTGVGPVQRGAIYLEPHNAPAILVAGDVWKTPGFAGLGRGGFEWVDADGAPGGGGIGKQRAWSTTNGIGRRMAEALADSTEPSSTPNLKVSLTLGTLPSPGDPLGIWELIFTATLRLGPGAAPGSRAVLEFLINGVVEHTHVEDFTQLGQPKIVTYFATDTLAGAPRTAAIRFYSQTPGNPVVCSKARIRGLGAFES